MKFYNCLVNEVADLHLCYAPAIGSCAGPLILPNRWIQTVVDTTSGTAQGKRPVIVTVGANYATGRGNLPACPDARHRCSPPWVEAGLNQWRKRVDRFLTACANGKNKRHWNGLLPFDPDQNYHLNIKARLDPEPHFVMSNLSPWITTRDWAKIRDNSLEDMFGILSAPGMSSGGIWGYFSSLKKCVGRDAIWIGHGNAEIYGLFRLLCWKLGIREWFFDSNLSQKSQMILYPKFKSLTSPRRSNKPQP